MEEYTGYANSIFEQPWWLEILAPGKWGEVVVEKGNEVIARLPYVLDKGKIEMPPLTQTLGPWMKPEIRDFLPGNKHLSNQKEIVSDLLGKLPKHKSLRITLDSVNTYILPYRWLGCNYYPTFSYRINNLSNPDKIYSNFHNLAKKNINSARKKVNVIESSNPWDIIGLLHKTFKNQGRKYPVKDEIVHRLIESSISKKSGKLLIAQDYEGNLHSSVFIVYDKNVCYYLLAGSDPFYRSSGANSLLLWEAIKFASSVSKCFDFEGSNIESIEAFIKQFGGELITNYVISKQTFINDFIELTKPRIKRIIGYKN